MGDLGNSTWASTDTEDCNVIERRKGVPTKRDEWPTYPSSFIVTLIVFWLLCLTFIILKEVNMSAMGLQATATDLVTQATKRLGRRGTIALGVISTYVVLCRGLRYLRRDRKHAQYPYKTRADFKHMTAQHAWEITKYVMSLEFPFTSTVSLQFALFRTYGIPTISSLLCSTNQLSELKNAPRRYADTSVLITEFLAHAPESERANTAIARMNYLHSLYQKSGKISNDDMLYTMSLFVLELERWIREYEWRSLTPMEICAIGTLWKSIGDAMGISWKDLRHGPDGFVDGLQFVDDLRVWTDAYEERALVPNTNNHVLAEETVNILLYDTPEFLKGQGEKIVVAFMDERLRKAMLYDKVSPVYSNLVHVAISIRKFFLRWLIPPRPYSLRFQGLSEDPDPKTGRYNLPPAALVGEPWYIKPTFFTRNSMDSWRRWITGRPYPNGRDFKPEGYTLLEVGPPKLEKSGLKECEKTRDRLMGAQRGRCPFIH